MPEILSLSHRALVMRGLTVAGELSKDELLDPSAQDKIFRLASGLEASTKKDMENNDK
jgi:ribose transport system ATP-binding protein